MSEEQGNRLAQKDFLWLHLRDLPYFRALLRAVESRFYQSIELPGPVLDVGCGDGCFASITFERPLDVGIDPWADPIREAVRSSGYGAVIQGYGSDMPFPDASFGSCISNSVLEHIPELDAVLAEIGRVLTPGAVFVFCVPNQQFLNNLSVSTFFDRMGLKWLGDRYRAFFNRISRHYHCDSPEVWQERLERAGFRLERWWHYFSPGALHALEWGHYLGVPSWIMKRLSGHWVLFPTRWNLGLTQRLLQPYYDEDPECADGSYTFYIAYRQSEPAPPVK
ncbi:MAG: class I SAM-dependent methyltransferase [Chloroflexi bacterium]|nr:class I SAM-dependent methyltransferase [Anaerolineaceae bacterium]NMB89884.1 class I SAM-dependent methyltransferase [Chloroflexota bacterium]